jgi:hypothetical protein
MAERRTLPPFDREVLQLFVRLEGVTDRDNDAFRKAEKELANRLGLSSELFCSLCSVLDKSRLPPRPWLHAHGVWHQVRRVREALLAAISRKVH